MTTNECTEKIYLELLLKSQWVFGLDFWHELEKPHFKEQLTYSEDL